LNRDREEFEAAGVRLVVIGMGTPGNASHFRESHHLDLELLVDTDRQAYKAAGAKKATFGELLGPRVVAKGMRRALASRVHQGRTIGHPAQLGGVMIVMPDGSVPWVHLSDDASDNPPNELVLEAARSATAG
jgi:prostamide/prostaglandin F2alpha synthase